MPGAKAAHCLRAAGVFTGSGRRVKQVLLTPFAVATDLTIVGGVVFFIACYVEAKASRPTNAWNRIIGIDAPPWL